MSYLARDRDNDLFKYENKPTRDASGIWINLNGRAKLVNEDYDERTIHKKITWEDEPVEIEDEKEEMCKIYVVSYYCDFDESWVLDNAYENKEDAEERAKKYLEEGYSIKEIKLFKSNK